MRSTRTCWLLTGAMAPFVLAGCDSSESNIVPPEKPVERPAAMSEGPLSNAADKPRGRAPVRAPAAAKPAPDTVDKEAVSGKSIESAGD